MGLVLQVLKGEKVIVGPPDNPIGTVEVIRVREGMEGVKLHFNFNRDIPVNRESVLVRDRKE